MSTTAGPGFDRPHLGKATERLLERNQDLVSSIASGDCALFVGAGLSMGAGLPGWGGLIQTLHRRLAPDLPPPHGSHLDYAERIERAAGRDALGQALVDVLGPPVPPTPAQRALVRLPWRAIFTTNFDHLLEHALDAEGLAYDPLRYDEEVGVLDQRLALPLVKFHGDLDDPPGIVLTRGDYELYRAKHPALSSLLELFLSTRTLVFVGFGLTDPNFLALDGAVRQALGRYSRRAFVVTRRRTGDPPRRLPADTYSELGVPPRKHDDFLLALAWDVLALRNAWRTLAHDSSPGLDTARDRVVADVHALPDALTTLDDQDPLQRPARTEGRAALVHRVAGLNGLAARLGVQDDACWLALGTAMWRLGDAGGALRALKRVRRPHPTVDRVVARCHWLRGDVWRVRRTLAPFVHGAAGAGHIDLDWIVAHPGDLALYAHACNAVAAQHLRQGRPERAHSLAAAALGALDAWREAHGDEPPRIPAWLWKYVHNHSGEARLLLVRCGEPVATHFDAAVLDLTRARSATWHVPWANHADLCLAANRTADATALLAEVVRRGGGLETRLREARPDLPWPAGLPGS